MFLLHLWANNFIFYEYQREKKKSNRKVYHAYKGVQGLVCVYLTWEGMDYTQIKNSNLLENNHFACSSCIIERVSNVILAFTRITALLNSKECLIQEQGFTSLFLPFIIKAVLETVQFQHEIRSVTPSKLLFVILVKWII